MKKLIDWIFLCTIYMFAVNIASANNISITSVSLTGQDATNNFSQVRFTLSWENSWRTSSAPSNYDAAWVFVKYRVRPASGGDGLWRHAWLNNTGQVAASGSTIDIGLLTPGTAYNASTNPGLGAFVYRSAVDGTPGTNTFTDIQLRWNYGVNYKTGTTPIGDNDSVDIQVFAVEMVYVPQGDFGVGTGGSEISAFTLTTINTGNATTVPTGSGSKGGLGGGYPTGQTAPGNDSWPNGFKAFYCMKYDISQQEYVDFLNTLTYTQQSTRTDIAPSSPSGTFLAATTNRYKLKISTPGTASTVPAIYATDLPYVACNYISWEDMASYLDWSGLRPMTELEFEKACRGTSTPLANEYAWGSTSIIQNLGITNDGLTTEIGSVSANCTYGDTVHGPMRVGCFATATSNRITSGATFYGIMDMSGNLWKRPITIGNAIGRAFTGIHGDGALDAVGDADVSLWPIFNADGVGFRGGNWSDGLSYSQVSDRAYATSTDLIRSMARGCRGVRTY